MVCADECVYLCVYEQHQNVFYSLGRYRPRVISGLHSSLSSLNHAQTYSSTSGQHKNTLLSSQKTSLIDIFFSLVQNLFPISILYCSIGYFAGVFVHDSSIIFKACHALKTISLSCVPMFSKNDLASYLKEVHLLLLRSLWAMFIDLFFFLIRIKEAFMIKLQS